MSDFATRDGGPDDAEAITAIYNEGIAGRQATFDTEPCSVEDIRADLRADAETHPTIVALEGERIVAFAWTSSYRTRACYRGVGEFSVYAAGDARGRGAGRAALTALIARCERLGFWKLLSRVFPENTASRALCRSAGFREVGVYHRHARLEGEWRDVVIVERLLGEPAGRASGYKV
jgi:L-amino acid N-acyltransferase YncA